jgi:hypothetical protein
MASNREQRRAAKRKGKRPGETYADQLARERMIKEAVEKTAHDESVALESDIKTQRFLWMSIEALNRAFGFAGIRAQRYMLTLDDVRKELEKNARENGWVYAIEDLRRRCEQITGMQVSQVHEDRMIQARKENEAKGIFFDAEDPEDLAAIGFTGARDTGPKWISVKERNPDINGRYLCNVSSYAFRGSFYQTILTYDKYGFRDGNVYEESVTHWMELPEGPSDA